jgi:acetyltransferase-like isoleucine patch superfamily enzyme
MIHPLADVHSLSIGDGTTVWQFAIILAGARIGNNCNINSHTFIENKVVLGNAVTVKCGVYLWDGITVEDNVFIGPNVTFINDPYPRSKQHLSEYPFTLISEGASIGANATIKCGLTIGKYAMVGAASMVTKNVRDYELWYGNPARHTGYVTKKGVILTLALTDKQSNQYFINSNGEPILKGTV